MSCPCERMPRMISVSCPNPVLTIGFPQVSPGPNSVTLANGAVVDLNVLGEVISTFCPSLARPTDVVVSSSFTGM